jgi:hypothetical protein
MVGSDAEALANSRGYGYSRFHITTILLASTLTRSSGIS